MSREEIILKDIIELQKTGNLLEFMNKLFIFNKLMTKQTSRSFIRVIYENIKSFSKIGRDNYWQSEYDRAAGFTFYLINEKFECAEITEIIYEIVDNTLYIPFIFNAAYFCLRGEGGSLYNIYECINIKELLEKIKIKLNKYYIVDRHNIFEELEDDRDMSFVLYQWATNWNIKETDNFEIVNSYLIPLLSQNSSNFLTFIMPYYRTDHYTRSQSKTFLLEEISKMVDIKKLLEIAIDVSNKISDKELKLMVEIFIEKANKFIEKK